VRCTMLRDGKAMEVTIPLRTSLGSGRLVPYTQYDTAPTYYLVGGLVLQPLTRNYLQTWNNMDDVPVHLADYYYHGRPSDDRKQVIVLTNILGDELTVGYDDFEDHVITHVNGKAIASIEDVVQAIEENKGAYHVLVDEWGNRIVLERAATIEAQKAIMERYKIDADRSADLQGS